MRTEGLLIIIDLCGYVDGKMDCPAPEKETELAQKVPKMRTDLIKAIDLNHWKDIQKCNSF